MKIQIILCFVAYSFAQVYGDGVKQCYTCDDRDCANITREDCSDTFLEYICLSTRLEVNGVLYQSKGCTSHSPNLVVDCQATNSAGGSCYVCNEDMCNKEW
ncbi:unnamed protein product [Tenebrio molitor]|jgi:hypothetical protein|nr:unnamed protein product [Tenebrio molitor]